MKRFIFVPLVIFIFFLSAVIGLASGKVEVEPHDWNAYMETNGIAVSTDWGTHVLATPDSGVSIAEFEYDKEERVMQAFYPPGFNKETSYPVLILIGNPDNELKADYGLPYRHTEQALGWGQVMAEEGFVVIAFQSERRPEKDVVNVVQWIRKNGGSCGMDGESIGLFSSSNACIPGLKALVSEDGGIPAPSVKFLVLAYGNLMNLSGLDTNTAYCVVSAQRDGWTDTSTIDSFLEKMEKAGAEVVHIHHKTGGHAFELRESSDETLKVLGEMIGFMKSHTE